MGYELTVDSRSDKLHERAVRAVHVDILLQHGAVQGKAEACTWTRAAAAACYANDDWAHQRVCAGEHHA